MQPLNQSIRRVSGIDAAAVSATEASAHSQPRMQRQFAAILWILLAWGAGTVVFELTATGGETDDISFAIRQDSFASLFGAKVDAEPSQVDSSSH